MNSIAFAFNNAESAQSNGIYVGGTKYVFNKIEDIQNVPVLHCAKVSILPFAPSDFIIPVADRDSFLEYRGRPVSSLPSVASPS